MYWNDSNTGQRDNTRLVSRGAAAVRVSSSLGGGPGGGSVSLMVPLLLPWGSAVARPHILAYASGLQLYSLGRPARSPHAPCLDTPVAIRKNLTRTHVLFYYVL